MDALLRPEVLACQKEIDRLHGLIEDTIVAAEAWATFTDHRHRDRNEDICTEWDCYEAWHEYPDG